MFIAFSSSALFPADLIHATSGNEIQPYQQIPLCPLFSLLSIPPVMKCNAPSKFSRSLFSLIAGVGAFLLPGCATPYQRSGFAGGFEETHLAPDVFRVSFNGNGFTTPQRCQEFALLRAAEVCQQKGFRYFAVLQDTEDANEAVGYTPGYSYTTASVTGYGNTAYGSASTVYTPSMPFVISKPISSMLVRCFRSPQTNPYTFDSDYIFQSIGSKYRISPSTLGSSGAAQVASSSAQRAKSSRTATPSTRTGSRTTDAPGSTSAKIAYSPSTGQPMDVSGCQEGVPLGDPHAPGKNFILKDGRAYAFQQ